MLPAYSQHCCAGLKSCLPWPKICKTINLQNLVSLHIACISFLKDGVDLSLKKIIIMFCQRFTAFRRPKTSQYFLLKVKEIINWLQVCLSGFKAHQ